MVRAALAHVLRKSSRAARAERSNVLVQLRPVYWPGRELPMTPVTVEVAQPLAMEPGSPVLLAWLMFELVLVSVWLAVLCGGLLVASPGLAGC